MPKIKGSVGDAVDLAMATDTSPPELSPRQQQVLLGMSFGRSNAEIGEQLDLTEDTIKTHARRLFGVLRARDRAHAVRIGLEFGLIAARRPLSERTADELEGWR